MRSREKIGVTLLALVFVGVGAYACSSTSDFGPQPFYDDVPSSSTTAPPAPENQDAFVQFPDSATGYDTDAAYAHTLCETTCSCNIGKKEYCVGQYTNLSFTTCELPDAGAGVDSGAVGGLRLGCNTMPEKCFTGGKPYCPCIIESLGTDTPCNIVCEDLTTGGVELYCPVP